TTQFVVGAAGETDQEILSTTSKLYQELQLKRVYFSAYRPVDRSRLEGIPPAPPTREHRLYQADWLMRVYGFRLDEIKLALGDKGNLPLAGDPKTVIALKQPWLFPVDVNLATYEQLVRVPGIGPVSARRIIEARREHSIFSTLQLRKMGVNLVRATPFIRFQGFSGQPEQLTLFNGTERERAEKQPSFPGG
ncbi:MAG: helix-hairpin-helix domain-containing protein, partial [Dehalococcoidia bacterium]|nr:helix-hairpin-helix domain-containing protein [Dehalococcoidia bacterium]